MLTLSGSAGVPASAPAVSAEIGQLRSYFDLKKSGVAKPW